MLPHIKINFIFREEQAPPLPIKPQIKMLDRKKSRSSAFFIKLISNSYKTDIEKHYFISCSKLSNKGDEKKSRIVISKPSQIF